MTALSAYLELLPEGPVTDVAGLVNILSTSWEDLAGSRGHAMMPWKLGRIESPEWHPPVLTFEIERHGAARYGSINAEVQQWEIDPFAGRAELVGARTRRIGKAAKPLNVKPIATDIAEVIRAGKDDPRITWQADRAAVQLHMSEILPPAVNQTFEGRVRRLYAALDAELQGEFVRGGSWYRTEERP